MKFSRTVLATAVLLACSATTQAGNAPVYSWVGNTFTAPTEKLVVNASDAKLQPSAEYYPFQVGSIATGQADNFKFDVTLKADDDSSLNIESAILCRGRSERVTAP